MRFPLEQNAPLRPYIVTAFMNRPMFLPRVPTSIQWYDPLDERHQAYCTALNRANSFAHDGSPSPGKHSTALGMPRWVQLDCCLLPAAMIGYETRREYIPPTIADDLDPSGTLEWIAVSEYVALPTVEPGRHTGISMFSLIEGRGLGLRSKALGLRAVHSSELIGVTQYASLGVAVHLRFGPLHIVSPSVAVHSRPGETFVYRLDVPQPEELNALANMTLRRMPIDLEREWEVQHIFDPRVQKAREEAMKYIQQAPTWVLGHGPAEHGQLTELRLGRPR